jgi:hypothetical protein
VYNFQAVDICLKYTLLHADYADAIVNAMLASMIEGTPVNPPIWWLDPTDEDALAVWDGKIKKMKIKYSRHIHGYLVQRKHL